MERYQIVALPKKHKGGEPHKHPHDPPKKKLSWYDRVSKMAKEANKANKHSDSNPFNLPTTPHTYVKEAGVWDKRSTKDEWSPPNFVRTGSKKDLAKYMYDIDTPRKLNADEKSAVLSWLSGKPSAEEVEFQKRVDKLNNENDDIVPYKIPLMPHQSPRKKVFGEPGFREQQRAANARGFEILKDAAERWGDDGVELLKEMTINPWERTFNKVTTDPTGFVKDIGTTLAIPITAPLNAGKELYDYSFGDGKFEADKIVDLPALNTAADAVSLIPTVGGVTKLLKPATKLIKPAVKSSRKLYNKVATGNTRIPYAWRSQASDANIIKTHGPANPLKTTIRENFDLTDNYANFAKIKSPALTDSEAKLLADYMLDPKLIKNKREEFTKLMQKLSLKNSDDVKGHFTRISNYHGVKDAPLPTKRGEIINFPSSRSMSQGTRQGPAYGGEGHYQRIVIPEKYAPQMKQYISKIPYEDPNLIKHVTANKQNIRKLKGEKEVLTAPGTSFKVIGNSKSPGGHFNDIIVKPTGQWEQGGFIDMELTETQAAEYAKGGYILEELTEGGPGGPGDEGGEKGAKGKDVAIKSIFTDPRYKNYRDINKQNRNIKKFNRDVDKAHEAYDLRWSVVDDYTDSTEWYNSPQFKAFEKYKNIVPSKTNKKFTKIFKTGPIKRVHKAWGDSDWEGSKKQKIKNYTKEFDPYTFTQEEYNDYLNWAEETNPEYFKKYNIRSLLKNQPVQNQVMASMLYDLGRPPVQEQEVVEEVPVEPAVEPQQVLKEYAPEKIETLNVPENWTPEVMPPLTYMDPLPSVEFVDNAKKQYEPWFKFKDKKRTAPRVIQGGKWGRRRGTGWRDFFGLQEGGFIERELTDKQANNFKEGGGDVRDGGGTYTVKSGDTFDAIAYANGFNPSELKAVNPGISYGNLSIGQVINIPEKKAVAKPATKIAKKAGVKTDPWIKRLREEGKLSTKTTKVPKDEFEYDDAKFIDEVYMPELFSQENASKAGYDPKTKLWYPTKAPEEGGGYDIFGGHKIGEHEDFSEGITTEQGHAQMRKDFESKKKNASKYINKTYGEDTFETLPIYSQAILTDYEYNVKGGIGTFKNFARGVVNNDKDLMLKEYVRYSDGKPLGRRNEMMKNWINKYYKKPGGFVVNLTEDQVKMYTQGGYIVEEIN